MCQMMKAFAPLSSGSPFTYKLTPRITRILPSTSRDAASQTLRSYVCITYAGAASPIRLGMHTDSGCCSSYMFMSSSCCIREPDLLAFQYETAEGCFSPARFT